MLPLAVTAAFLDETVRLLRDAHQRLAGVSKLLHALELDRQQGQTRNLDLLVHLAQQRCAAFSQDLDQQIERLQVQRNDLPASAVTEPLVSAASLELPERYDHIDWLVALMNALHADEAQEPSMGLGLSWGKHLPPRNPAP
ncbi:hypothetical protein FGA82_29095 [Pseudomonas fluorescens]|uniref:hypothetical protein n=1 Tax=Pseudomonas fluorescens TaxID=294 RepID=UPI001130E42D|nr:hypothetical protein [Pseudomonas fluorescens]TMU69927.1 hypothetical protein FGA82_29095 [Pseudomonas fluorescens]